MVSKEHLLCLAWAQDDLELALELVYRWAAGSPGIQDAAATEYLSHLAWPAVVDNTRHKWPDAAPPESVAWDTQAAAQREYSPHPVEGQVSCLAATVGIQDVEKLGELAAVSMEYSPLQVVEEQDIEELDS